MPESVEYQLAMRLFKWIHYNNPKHLALTNKQEQQWADNIRLMIQRDHRSPQEIKSVIDWCQSHQFWKTNILSTAKLRKQFDTLTVQMDNDSGTTRTNKKRVYS